jgi:AraC-like DNA-binding protein
MTEHTIAAGNARALMDLAVTKGASRQALAARSGIDPAELQEQDNRVPFAKYIALMRTAQELCRDPALALHFGEAVDFAEISVVGLIGRASETMADGFAQFNRYARLVVDDGQVTDRLVLERSAGQLWMVDTRQYADDFPEFAETSFARMVCTSRRWFPEAQFIKAVHFTHPAPAYRAEYDRVFQLPVVFESDKNALLTYEAWLTHRNPHASRYVFGILSAHAEELLQYLERSKTTRGRVESLLIPILHTGEASVDVIAGKMGISRQTLFRKLKAEGVTFEKVLDELRHKLALHYLSGKKVSVNETAYLVGFSDPASFSRAFKRWTGRSPRNADLEG